MTGMELPAFIEVTPGSFKPLEACTRAEVQSAVEGYMAHALLGANDTVSFVEADGGRSVLSEDLWSKAEDDRAVALALMRYLDAPTSGDSDS